MCEKLNPTHMTCNVYNRMQHYSTVMFNSLFAVRGLSLSRLRVLLEVDEAGSIAAAAESNPVRQSQYSRQLRELEEFFGVELTRREGRYLRLTERGGELAHLARETLLGLSDFKDACDSKAGTLRVGAGDSVIRWLIAPSLPAISARLQGMSISLKNVRTSEAIRQLSEIQIDLAVVRKDAIPEHLKHQSVGRLEYALYVPKRMLPGQVASKLKHLSLVDIVADYPFGRLAEGRKLSCLQEERLLPTPFLLTDSLPSLCNSIQQEVCCGILPSLAQSELPQAKFASFRPPEMSLLSRDLALAWNSRFEAVRRNAAESILVFTEELRSFFSRAHSR